MKTHTIFCLVFVAFNNFLSSNAQTTCDLSTPIKASPITFSTGDNTPVTFLANSVLLPECLSTSGLAITYAVGVYPIPPCVTQPCPQYFPLSSGGTVTVTSDGIGTYVPNVTAERGAFCIVACEVVPTGTNIVGRCVKIIYSVESVYNTDVIKILNSTNFPNATATGNNMYGTFDTYTLLNIPNSIEFNAYNTKSLANYGKVVVKLGNQYQAGNAGGFTITSSIPALKIVEISTHLSDTPQFYARKAIYTVDSTGNYKFISTSPFDEVQVLFAYPESSIAPTVPAQLQKFFMNK